MVHTMCDLSGEEVFDPTWIGHAEKVYEERYADDECMIIQGTKSHVCSSIILRGANAFVLDEMERAMNDCLWAVARTLDANSVVPGGGAVEASLNVYLEEFSKTIESREQLAVAEFAAALMIIPKTLSLNAALDATDNIAKLRVEHFKAVKDGKKEFRFMGLDLHEGGLRDNVIAGVLEPQPSKIKSFQFATEAAITVLRIDDTVRLNPPEDEEDPRMRR